MTFEIINTIGDSFLELFGNPFVVALVIIFFIVTILLTVKAGKVVILTVIVPLIVSLTTFGISRFITVDFIWINLLMWMFLGIIFATVFWLVIR